MSWRKSRDYRIWRIKVIRRDKKCQICGTKKKLQAHHKNSGSYFPEQRFKLENGVTLCNHCHTNYHTNFHRSFRAKCTEYDFQNFVTLTEYFKKSICK
jgi:5-methylcytosine-specific restriction endonuclease McrA